MNTVIIQGEPIEVKEYQGQRVVTFKEIDRVHGRPEGTAKRNFNRNMRYFTESVDFFKISRKTFNAEFVPKRKTFNTEFVPNPETLRGNPNLQIILITESGYLLLVKSLTDGLAWEVQKNLIDGYFRMRLNINLEENTIETSDPDAVLNTDQLIRCAEVMANCLDGNRSYVLNILRKVVPEIDQEDDQPNNKTDYNIPFNHQQFKNFMSLNGVTAKEISEKSGISEKRIYEYRSGKVVPKMQTRKRLAMALGLPADYFNNSKRVRRIKEWVKH